MRGVGLLVVCLLCSFGGWAAEPGTGGGELAQMRGILGGQLVFSVVVATAVGCVGLMLLAAGLVPTQVAKAEAALRSGRWKVVLLGIVSIGVLLLAAHVLGRADRAGARVLGVVALAVLGFLVWLAAVGLAGNARIIGGRLLGDEAGAQPPWRTVGAGALVIGASALVPVFGTAVFLYLFCRGVGAATLALFSGSAPQAAQGASPSVAA